MQNKKIKLIKTPDGKFEADIKPCTLTELAEFYHVDWKTFQRWVNEMKNELGKKHGRYFTIPQVQMILDEFGIPKRIELDPGRN